MNIKIFLMASVLCFLFAICVHAQDEARSDSVSINKKYYAKQAEIQKEFDERVKELINNDPQLNQLRGASFALEKERQEALQALTPALSQEEREKEDSTKKVSIKKE